MRAISKVLLPVLGTILISALGAAAFLWFRTSQSIHSITISTSRFGDVRLLKPTEGAQGFVLYIADWSADSEALPAMAETLTQLGFSVGLVDTERYQEALKDNDDDCTLFSGELNRLSQVLQKNAGLPRLFQPLIGGEFAGAAIAMSALAQSPQDFKGALLLNFCPQLTLSKPLCPEDGLSSKGAQIDPPQHLTRPVFLWNEPNGSCTRESWETFIAPIAHASIKEKPFVPSELARFIRGASFLENNQTVGSIAELPVIDLFPSGDMGEDLVIFLSGDGGWATIDKEIGEVLRKRGITVVGFDTLRYFWKRRTAEQTAVDLERIIEHYRAKHSFKRVSLIGFSFGADVLPALVNLLDEETRSSLQRVVLLNPGLTYDFEVNLSDWLNMVPQANRRRIADDLSGLPGQKLVCIFTSDEREESVCPSLRKGAGKVLELAGDHHFDGDYSDVADKIIGLIGNDGSAGTK